MKFKPTWCCKNIFTLDLNYLKSQNIKYIFTDLDNTLAPYNVLTPSKEVFKLIEDIKKEGFNLIIVSNNTGKRVKLFASDLNVEYISGAKKPFKFVIKKYLKTHKIELNECVLIGDQLVTDIKCANRLGCKCILTEPLTDKEAKVTFFNRKIDRYYRKKYNFFIECERIDRGDSND